MRAIAQMAKGRSRQAADALTSPGLCPHTDKVRQLLIEKHPADSEEIGSQPRPPPPAADRIATSTLALSIMSFARGTGAGPTQLKAEHLKIVIGEGGQEEELLSLAALAKVFADGHVPKHLAKYYAGGNLVGRGKPGKGLEEDVGPI